MLFATEVFTEFIPEEVDLVVAGNTLVPLFTDDLYVLDVFTDIAFLLLAFAKRIFIVNYVLGSVQNQAVMTLDLILFGLTVYMTMSVHMSVPISPFPED